METSLECLRNHQKVSAGGILKDIGWVALDAARKIGVGKLYMAPDCKPCHSYKIIFLTFFSELQINE